MVRFRFLFGFLLNPKYKCSSYDSLNEVQVGKWSSEVIRAIKKVTATQELKDSFSQESFSWKLGDGKLVKFWHDIWTGTLPLKNVFKKLYSLSILKDLSIASTVEYLREREN